jgi:hypothetical protein
VAFSDGAIVAQASHAIDGSTVPIIDNECQKPRDKRPATNLLTGERLHARHVRAGDPLEFRLVTASRKARKTA